MATRRNWTEDEVTEALSLYLRLPFGKFHSGTPQIIHMAERIGRTPSSVAMKLSNLAALDETLPQKGLANLSAMDRQMWARYRQIPPLYLPPMKHSLSRQSPRWPVFQNSGKQTESPSNQRSPDVRWCSVAVKASSAK